MKKYRVVLTKTQLFHTSMEVEAVDAIEAAERAYLLTPCNQYEPGDAMSVTADITELLPDGTEGTQLEFVEWDV